MSDYIDQLFREADERIRSKRVNAYDEFMAGVEAKKKGLPCPADASDIFSQGYATESAQERIAREEREYEVEQRLTHYSLRRDGELK